MESASLSRSERKGTFGGKIRDQNYQKCQRQNVKTDDQACLYLFLFTLEQLFEVSGIPHFVILDENDKIITDNGRAAVSSDPEGSEFPWHPKPLDELDEVCIIGMYWYV